MPESKQTARHFSTGLLRVGNLAGPDHCSEHRSASGFSSGRAASLARWSYAVYLAHKPIFIGVAAVLRQRHLDTDAPVGIAVIEGGGRAGIHPLRPGRWS
jgi:peptidoglycan/LPS O-acetylase OafA/YrhL